MKRVVRSLNYAGIEIFKAWLSNPISDAPTEILDDPQYSEEFDGGYVVDSSLAFETTYELGQYLHEKVFAGVTDVVSHSAADGMWAWISLALIQHLLSKSEKRKNKPLDLPHYIVIEGPQGRRIGYRLIARTAWKLVRIHGESARVAIGSKRSPWGEMAEQMTSRQEIFAHPSFWAVATRLYQNTDGELRRGATSQRPLSARKDPKNKAGRGGVRRLPLTFRQFDRTYHMRDMPIDLFMEVLPREYEKWVKENEA